MNSTKHPARPACRRALGLGTPRRSSGFTLIELLTVIAIIGILAGIIIPVVGKVRSTALKADCTSNLRQISQALVLYLNENKSVLPIAYADTQNQWRKHLLRGGYLGKPDNVVARPGITPPGPNPANWNEYHFRVLSCKAHVKKYDAPDSMPTYAMNGTAAQASTQNGTASPYRRLSEHQAPSRTLIVADGAPLGNDGSTAFNPALWANASNYKPDSAHGSAANLLFLDGHVESRSASEIPTDATPVGSAAWVFWGPR